MGDCMWQLRKYLSSLVIVLYKAWNLQSRSWSIPCCWLVFTGIYCKKQKSRVGVTANKEIKRKTYKAFKPHRSWESEILMAMFTFWCECWWSQGHSVISLVFLLAFLNCGVYNLHFRTFSALNITHFLLFLEQLQIKYPLDDKVIDNKDFKHWCNWKPLELE